MEKIILTGDRPTGRLHVGHYVGSLKRRVELQNSGEYDKIFIMIADAQALTDNADNPEKIRQNIIEVALDYLSCGLDPEKCTIFIQSQVPELAELSFFYMNLVTVSRLQRNPTVKTEIQMRNFETSIPVGFFTYPISQASDITAFKATTVPVGEDQLPMIEQAREIVRKFNSVYGETLVEPTALIPENEVCCRLPGTDGKAKMSKSLGNCIYLSDTEEEVRQKLNLKETEKVYKLVRLRYVDDQPNVLVTTYVPCRLFEHLSEVDFEKESLYQTFHKEGRDITSIQRKLDVILADETCADLLDVKNGDPLFYFHSTGYDESHTAIEYSIAKYRGDRNSFVFQLSNNVYYS